MLNRYGDLYGLILIPLLFVYFGRIYILRTSVVKLASRLAELAEFAFSAMEIEWTRLQNRSRYRIAQTRSWLGENRLTRRVKTEYTEFKIWEVED